MPYMAKIHEMQDPAVREARIDRDIKNAFLTVIVDEVIDSLLPGENEEDALRELGGYFADAGIDWVYPRPPAFQRASHRRAH